MTPLVIAAFDALPPELWWGGSLFAPPSNDEARAIMRGTTPRPRPVPARPVVSAAQLKRERDARNAQIVALHADGAGIGAIASLLQCSHRTVRQAIREVAHDRA